MLHMKSSRAAYMREYRKRRKDPAYQPIYPLGHRGSQGRPSRYGGPPINDKDERLREKFHISLRDYLTLLEGQDNVCYLCRQPETVKIRGKVIALAVDHHHGNGAIRYLLCGHCNRMVGYIERRPQILKRLSRYIQQLRFGTSSSVLG